MKNSIRCTFYQYEILGLLITIVNIRETVTTNNYQHTATILCFCSLSGRSLQKYIAFALLINPNSYIEEIDPTQPNSPAESSCEITSTLLIHGDYIKLKYSSQTTKNKVLRRFPYMLQSCETHFNLNKRTSLM